jgi:hypothetical protein
LIVLPYTFQCKELLFVLGRMLPPPELSEPGSATQAAAQLANTISRNVYVVDDTEVLAELDEPVEAVVFARQLELRIERCIASPLALELVREAGEPAHSSWQWLCTRARIVDPRAPSVVQVPQLARTQLPAGVDQIPDGSGVLFWRVGEPDEVVFIDREYKLEDHGIAIVPYRGTWAIQDRGTLSGLYVDGYRCKARCLVPGMTIRIGIDRFAILSVR